MDMTNENLDVMNNGHRKENMYSENNVGGSLGRKSRRIIETERYQ